MTRTDNTVDYTKIKSHLSAKHHIECELGITQVVNSKYEQKLIAQYEQKVRRKLLPTINENMSRNCRIVT